MTDQIGVASRPTCTAKPAAGNPPTQVTKRVVVVHGVGDPQPGDALMSLVKTYCVLADASPLSAPIVEQRPSTPNGPDNALLETFPVHRVRTLSHSGADLVEFSEVYWGDLSRVKGSVFGLVLGAIDLVFGLRHVVAASRAELRAASGKWLSPFAWIVRTGAAATLWLARGPILAINILLGIVLLNFMASVATRQHDVTTAALQSNGWVSLLISSLLCFVLGAILNNQALRAGWSTTTAEGMMTVGGLGLAAFVVTYYFVDSSLLTYANIAEAGTSLMALCAIAMAVTGLLAVAGSTVLLLCATLWRKMATALQVKRAVIVINVCTVLSSVLFGLALMAIWALAVQQLQKAAPEMAMRIEAALHLFSLLWGCLLLLALCYVGIVCVNRFRAVALERELKTNDKATRHFPRYIVAPLAAVIVMLFGAVWPALFLGLAIHVGCGIESSGNICAHYPIPQFVYQLGQWAADIDNLNKAAILLTVGTASILTLMHTHLGSALDIVIDVITHFRQRERVLYMPVEFRASPQEKGFFKVNWPDRASSDWIRMVDRCRKVLDETMSADDCESITVIAHSQGTMIALEALRMLAVTRKDLPDAVPRGVIIPNGKKVTVVTMGCPLTHLYQYYVPGRYEIQPRRTEIVGWINLYRQDDFVGRDVAGGVTGFPKNIAIGPRGHVNYWSDQEVFRKIQADGAL